MIPEYQKKAVAKYKKANIKRIPLEVQIKEFDQIQAAAAAAGETVNGYIKKAIRDRMETGF